MKSSKLPIFLWILAPIFFLLIPISSAYKPDISWLPAVPAGLLVLDFVALLLLHRRQVSRRTFSYGAQSIVTVIAVIGIVGVINFIASKHELKKDLTKNKIHTLSDQTKKQLKLLKEDLRVVMFGQPDSREQHRLFIDNLKAENPDKFKFEFVDPQKEMTRTRAAGIKRVPTVQLLYGTKDSKIEEVTEEKFLNALIKVTMEKTPTLCPIVGHGERSFTSTAADGLELVRRGLADQTYEVKELNLLQESKIPDVCDAVAIFGASKTFFENEIKVLSDYLAKGGRAIVALEFNVKGGEFSPELLGLLEKWHVRAEKTLVIDPMSRMLGVDAAVPIIASFAKDHPITKDFDAKNNCLFPVTRSLKILPNTPPGLNVQWLAQSTPNSWAESDAAGLAKGQVSLDERDEKGPINVAVSIQGKLPGSEAKKDTRILVFGSAQFAFNQYAGAAGNMDFVLNAMSWIMENENLISVRPKEEDAGKIELPRTTGIMVFWLTVIIIPIFIAVMGIVIWAIRRRW